MLPSGGQVAEEQAESNDSKHQGGLLTLQCLRRPAAACLEAGRVADPTAPPCCPLLCQATCSPPATGAVLESDWAASCPVSPCDVSCPAICCDLRGGGSDCVAWPLGTCSFVGALGSETCKARDPQSNSARCAVMHPSAFILRCTPVSVAHGALSVG